MTRTNRKSQEEPPKNKIRKMACADIRFAQAFYFLDFPRYL
ncbi:hypothetical protein ADIS_3264 [Lunatimonas lonarensis]|uniref:Uncharacterized protein n=1 Tax=Lunatimonas lonarensis TaxID=1232681 RepID=R7ZPT7_9BACT|nr:hypothetical protein ADIS_3264 [Lunatimonas lonarensis]